MLLKVMVSLETNTYYSNKVWIRWKLMKTMLKVIETSEATGFIIPLPLSSYIWGRNTKEQNFIICKWLYYTNLAKPNICKENQV
jgi:hypothetical protein